MSLVLIDGFVNTPQPERNSGRVDYHIMRRWLACRLACIVFPLITVLKSAQEVLVIVRKYKDADTTPENEVSLRRLTVDEALLKLDKYLNDAFMAGLYQVRVVHGKGTGTLQQVVHKVLARHPLVKSYRLGLYGEGGAGVTIVELAHR